MRRAIVLTCLFLLLAAVPSLAEETRITVHVLSHDAKMIGSSMGGARVTIRAVDTGELLAEGVTRGTTGDTEKLVVEPARRGVPVSSGTASGSRPGAPSGRPQSRAASTDSVPPHHTMRPPVGTEGSG